MLQFPYGVYPSGQALDGEIDNKFYCTISGTICTAYQIKIYDNNTKDIVYTGTKTDVSKYNQEILEMNVVANSFGNGSDLIWNMRLWTNNYDMKVATNTIISVPSSTTLRIEPYSTSRIKVGQKIQIGNKQYSITNYVVNGDDYATITTSETIGGVSAGDRFVIYSNFIDTPMYYFKSRSLPLVSIKEFPSAISSRKYEFTGSYSQSENVALQYYTFNLYDGVGEIIDTTDKVYSANIKYSYDGFLNNSKYSIELICITQDNIEVSTGKIEFSVSYSQPNVDLSIRYQVLDNKDAIRVLLEPDKTSIPTFNGEYEIVQDFPFKGTNSARIKKSALEYNNISQNPLSIDDSSYSLFMSTRLNNGFEGKVIELSNSTASRYINLFGYSFYDVKNTVSTKILDIYKSNKFVLQSSQEDDVGYVWNNSSTWDNSKFWWLPKNNLNSKQFKINILPSSTTIKEV